MNDKLNITMREFKTRQDIARNKAIKETVDALVASGALVADDYRRTIEALESLGWKNIPATSFAASRLNRG